MALSMQLHLLIPCVVKSLVDVEVRDYTFRDKELEIPSIVLT